jgi:hypothetical protein
MFTRTAISLLAVAALLAVAPAAGAHPIRDASSTSSLAGTTSPAQDLRGEQARDATRADQIAAQMKRYQAARPEPISAPKPAPAPAPSDGTPWAVIGISLFAALVAAGGAVLYVRLPRRNTLARS